MIIEFTCQKCEGSFELEAQDLIEGTEKLVCPHCDAKAPLGPLEDFTSALADLRTHIATLGPRFSIALSIATEELEEELDDLDDELDDDDDEDELDFDEDEDEELDDE